MNYRNINVVLFTLFLFMQSTSKVAAFYMAQRVYEFSFTAFQNCYIQNGGNTIMSPFSAQTILGLAYAGSSEQTAADMLVGLDLTGQTKQEVINDFNIILRSLQKPDKNTTLTIANKIYIKDSFQINPTFAIDAANVYSLVQRIDFSNIANAVGAINGWVGLKTNGAINTIITSNDITVNTVIILLNAIYFKGTWKTKFDKTLTSLSSFYTSSSNIEQIPMMNVRSSFGFQNLDELGAKVLKMPYTDFDLSMVLLLPYQRYGLLSLLSNLQKSNINDILSHINTATVTVKIPKFTIKSDFNLRDPLTKMGMGIIFTDHADFSGMVVSDTSSSQSILAITNVMQKAYIEVNEDGATAAAITETSVNLKKETAQRPVLSFIADHPFLFMILKNDAVLFVGSFVGGASAPDMSSYSSANSSPSVSNNNSIPLESNIENVIQTTSVQSNSSATIPSSASNILVENSTPTSTVQSTTSATIASASNNIPLSGAPIPSATSVTIST